MSVANSNTEVWRDVPGFVGLYQVSNHGRVKSLQRWVNNNGGRRLLRERILKPRANRNYRYVALCKVGKVKNHYIHRLVSSAFISNTENKPEVNHIDGNPTNNDVSNLEWVTRVENQTHAIESGLRTNVGEHHPMAKISKSDAKYIREMKGKVIRKDLANEFGLAPQTISDIQSGRRWGHL